ncbi:EAL domain-containing protein [Venenivibrio stagnispumantis]
MYFNYKIIDDLSKLEKISGIIIEITERELVDMVEGKEKIEKLRMEGVKISIDDFGTGYSSLKYLIIFKKGGMKDDRSSGQ